MILFGEILCTFLPPLPPNFGTKPKRGGKVTKRRKEDGEKERKQKKGTRMKRQQKTVTCKKCGTKGHNSATCSKQRVNECTSEPIVPTEKSRTLKRKLAPPRITESVVIQEVADDDGIATQRSQVTTVRWYAPPQPQITGPTPHQQLQMAETGYLPKLQPRVQFRAPPPYSNAHFTTMAMQGKKKAT